uniref:Uncharacterized protein n=1 Tax=Octopus bimaculoides TaxID=37653 RepID=A0A0L8HXP7_OCTBM
MNSMRFRGVPSRREFIGQIFCVGKGSVTHWNMMKRAAGGVQGSRNIIGTIETVKRGNKLQIIVVVITVVKLTDYY